MFETASHEHGYIPSRPRASPTHLLVMAAAIIGTMYSSPPVSSNMMTTKETATLHINKTYELYCNTIYKYDK